MNGTPSKPEKEFHVGAVRVAVWTNERQTAAGKAFQSHRIQLERRYKDFQGNFKSTHSLDLNDVPKAILALKKAYEYLTLRDGPPVNRPDMTEGFASVRGSA